MSRTCQHCGQVDPRSLNYRMGLRIGDKIIEQCGGDAKKREAWVRFLQTFRTIALVVTADIADFLDGALDSVKGLKDGARH